MTKEDLDYINERLNYLEDMMNDTMNLIEDVQKSIKSLELLGRREITPYPTWTIRKD